MTKYRIVPRGTERWTVQERTLGVFWTGSHWRDFESESEAETWIRGVLYHEALDLAQRKAAKDRRKRYVPRVYP